MDGGSVIVERAVHCENAASPIEVTDNGRAMTAKELHSVETYAGTVFVNDNDDDASTDDDDDDVIEVSVSQPIKADAPIVVILDVNITEVVVLGN